ncbi:hypothetical protein, partial [Luteipulveratus flavus]
MATETGSAYVLDLNERTLCREELGHPLRHDREVLPLHQVVQCRVGDSADFLIEPPRDVRRLHYWRMKSWHVPR